ncbi:MAG: inositol monophosphatase family protein [Bacteroidia bacterium]|nr:inositol monophosphatase family protein [Bacteroidia bacterium]
MAPHLDPTLDSGIRQLLQETGAYIAQEFRSFEYAQVEFKGAFNPFTYVDVGADERLRAGCARLLPGSGFINEELEDQPGTNEYVWVIDPIDGTSNFTHGVPHFCISLALQAAGSTVLGYVYEPVSGRLFHAVLGGGAWLDGTPIRVSRRPMMAEGLIATGFPYQRHARLEAHLRAVDRVVHQAHGLRRMGSAALDLAYVAAGRYAGYFEYSLNPWDVAAGALLVTEAGGQVTDYRGGAAYGSGAEIVATNGLIHAELLGLLQEADRSTAQNHAQNS